MLTVLTQAVALSQDLPAHSLPWPEALLRGSPCVAASPAATGGQGSEHPLQTASKVQVGV